MDVRRLLPSLLLLAAACPVAADPPLRLATTTSTANSGLLDVLLPAFTRATGYTVDVSSVGSGTALRMGRKGQTDILLVNAPAAEERFVRDGHGAVRHCIMHNDFVIVGPPGDPAGLGDATDVGEALSRLYRHKANFVSRGDDSGTHKKELMAWAASKLDPYGQDWYREMGLGMGALLRLASDDQAYALTDRGTWLKLKAKLRLRVLLQGDPVLHNPYSLISVNPARHPQVNHHVAKALTHWLRSPAAQRLIRDYRIRDEQLFVPGLPTE